MFPIRAGVLRSDDVPDLEKDAGMPVQALLRFSTTKNWSCQDVLQLA